MSLCQPQNKQNSCGACCGIFNLKLNSLSFQKILKERTKDFSSNVSFDEPWKIAEYRQRREKIEAEYKKVDEMIYNCPYLGFIDKEYKKIGCMIHPERTKDPKSQNFSFYGSSICQGYTCTNFDRQTAGSWQKIFDSMELNYFEYSNLAADHITINCIEKFFLETHISLDRMFSEYKNLLIDLLFLKLRNKRLKPLLHQTSFEIDTNLPEKTNLEKLAERLKLKKNGEIYQKLLDIYHD